MCVNRDENLMCACLSVVHVCARIDTHIPHCDGIRAPLRAGLRHTATGEDTAASALSTFGLWPGLHHPILVLPGSLGPFVLAPPSFGLWLCKNEVCNTMKGIQRTSPANHRDRRAHLGFPWHWGFGRSLILMILYTVLFIPDAVSGLTTGVVRQPPWSHRTGCRPNIKKRKG